MMTVADLIKKLEGYNPDGIVLLAKDAEGNDYSSLDDFSVEFVEAAYDGGQVEDLFDKDELLDDPDMTPTSLKANFKEALIFWPA